MISKFTLILPFSMCMHHKQNKIEYTQNNTFVRAGKIRPPKDRLELTIFSRIEKSLYFSLRVLK